MLVEGFFIQADSFGLSGQSWRVTGFRTENNRPIMPQPGAVSRPGSREGGTSPNGDRFSQLFQKHIPRESSRILTEAGGIRFSPVARNSKEFYINGQFPAAQGVNGHETNKRALDGTLLLRF
ncbi:hypothetical protein SKAU_G00104240 [Synaphobranchus kaupii]|uniref:Uncharacterized protein n=1 Tax=Synaphobranchus kaupii TaxID=118154 RepID=A0A9Q1J7Q5_SYNKA|nr:hypothetical protein SKAU_G00104240 [Synaphobranchus kaupii]